MSDFSKVAFIICAFVTMREFRPVEPFFTSYLTSPPLNFTTEQVSDANCQKIQRFYDPSGQRTLLFFVGQWENLPDRYVRFVFIRHRNFSHHRLPQIQTGHISRWSYRHIDLFIAIRQTGNAYFLCKFARLPFPNFIRTGFCVSYSMVALCLQIEQLFYGFFYSSDIACNTYLYAKVEDSSLYQKITGYVRASSLMGRFISGVFAQVTISYKLLNKSDLVYFSTGGEFFEIWCKKWSILWEEIEICFLFYAGMIIVTLWSFFIPSVDHSIYFHKVEKKIIQINGNKDDPEDGKIEEKVFWKWIRYFFSRFLVFMPFFALLFIQIITVVKSQKLSSVGKRLFNDFKMAYTNTYVLKWSLWWALALCGFFFVSRLTIELLNEEETIVQSNVIFSTQVNTYSQVLWQITAQEHGGEKYLMNGAIDSIYTISSTT